MKKPTHLSEMWNDLASTHQLSMHACLDEAGDIVLFLFPNAVLSSSTSARDYAQLCEKVLLIPGFVAFLSSAGATTTPDAARFRMRGIGKYIPLPASRALESGLSTVFDAATGRWTWGHTVSKRFARAMAATIQCEVTAPAFRFFLPENGSCDPAKCRTQDW